METRLKTIEMKKLTMNLSNFKKLSREEQKMVNGGSVGNYLYCKKITSGCQSLYQPNGQPCAINYDGSWGGNTPGGALLCSARFGGGANDYYMVGNEFTACLC